jgi:hypothetical protein
VPLLSAGVFIFEQSLFGMIHQADEHVCVSGVDTTNQSGSSLMFFPSALLYTIFINFPSN